MAMLRWREPASFKRALARQNPSRSNRWYPPLLALGVIVVGLGAMAYHNKPIAGNWPLTVAAAVSLGLLLAYGLPLLASRDPNLIVISERGIGWRVMQGGAIALETWTWDQIAYCTLSTMTVEGREYRVLLLHSAAEEQMFFAIDPDVENQAVEAAVRRYGCEFRLEDA